MSIFQRRFAVIRRYVLGVLLSVPLVFAPGPQPQAATLVTDVDGLVTDITSLSVDGLFYDTAFESGTYNTLFGGVFFADAQNFVTGINALFNALNPLTPLINTGSGAESGYLVPLGPGPNAFFILAPLGECGIIALDLKHCLASSVWSGGTTLVPGVDQVVTYAVPSLVSAIPLPAALPLFGSALAMLGIVGWRRRRQADA